MFVFLNFKLPEVLLTRHFCCFLKQSSAVQAEIEALKCPRCFDPPFDWTLHLRVRSSRSWRDWRIQSATWTRLCWIPPKAQPPSYRKRIFVDLWNGVISVAMVAFLLRCLEATGATAAAEERKKQEHQVHRIGKLCKRCFASKSITLARLLTYKKHWTTWATRHKELSHSNQESSSRLLFSWLKWKESAEETWSFQSVLARFNAKWLALDMFDMFAMFAWYDHAMSCWRHLLTWCYLCIGVA